MSKETLLIHGWDPQFYNSNIGENTTDGIAWSHRLELIRLLSKKYVLNYFNLPGFCGVSEPEKERFNVEDFTDYFANWIKKSKKNPEVIIGYSFGGVVALDYKVRYDNSIPTILISPAIHRGESSRSKFAHLAKNVIPEGISEPLKKYYQYLFSRYYRNGTPFLRESYDLIVRRDIISELNEVDPKSLLLIYGLEDNATPWKQVEDKAIKLGLQYGLIENGGHNIGQTHPGEIVEFIDKLLKTK